MRVNMPNIIEISKFLLMTLKKTSSDFPKD